MADPAPFHHEVAGGPSDVRVVWARAEDGVRLRVAVWPGGARGTVLLFTGRTEYLEKYGTLAGDLRAMGLSTISIDWRGQGLADRDLPDARTGHVADFTHYQRDVAVLLAQARQAGLPEPFFLLAHSMGGCIGLRALYDGLPVQAACFTAPMWGIMMLPIMRPVAWVMSWAARKIGRGGAYVPGTKPVTYMAEAAFEDNVLTTDREMFQAMWRQVTTYPELSIGGPSLHWLNEALIETRRLSRRPSPDLPCVTLLGSNERVVATVPIEARMRAWPRGRLDLLPGAEHEVLMERPEIRARALEAVRGLFLGESG